MNAARRAAFWAIPPLFCLYIYWVGLKSWFQQDDFAWLGLHLHIQTPGDLWPALFAPMAQGTIRPLSERGFFLAFYSLFGLNALPFRIWVFLTQSANLVLLSAIAWKLTKSRAAAFLAPLFWVVSCGLAVPMTWTSAYNQVLCAFFILLGLYLFIRYTETAKGRYYAGQWVAFLLGFGALEINVVYPVLLAALTLVNGRRHFKKVLPVFAASGIYAAVHTWAAPKAATTGPYALHFDFSMLATLRTYWGWALAAVRVGDFRHVPAWFGAAATVAITAGIAWFITLKVRKGNSLPLFFLGWFVITLLPVLPLRDHISDYYLVLPAAGLALMLAWAAVAAWRTGMLSRAAAILLAGVFVWSSLTVTRRVARFNYERSRDVKRLVLGVKRAHELHPDTAILLAGVSNDLFWAGVYDRPFRLFGMNDVYVTPDSAKQIVPFNGADISSYFLASNPALLALEEGRAVVYQPTAGPLKNVTSVYLRTAWSRWQPELPRRIEVGNPLYVDQLGREWYPIESGFRWMPQRARVRLGGPKHAGAVLHLVGFCPDVVSKSGTVALTATVEGVVLPSVDLAAKDGRFDVEFPLPSTAAGKPALDVVIEFSRSFKAPNDGRILAAAFGIVEVR